VTLNDLEGLSAASDISKSIVADAVLSPRVLITRERVEQVSACTEVSCDC